MFTGVDAYVVGFHSADLITTALLQMRQHLRTTVDVFGRFMEIVTTAESAPVFGSNLRRTDRADVRNRVFTKRATPVTQTRT